jgi:hypothetical protein
MVDVIASMIEVMVTDGVKDLQSSFSNLFPTLSRMGILFERTRMVTQLEDSYNQARNHSHAKLTRLTTKPGLTRD